MGKYEFGTALFDKESKTFFVKTPRGEFHNVKSIGGFDNYRQMDEYISENEMEELRKHGLMAYLFGSDEKMFQFFYPNGGDITVYQKN